jgi:hypothetical protein
MRRRNNRTSTAAVQSAGTTITSGGRELRVSLDLTIPDDAWLQLFDLDLPAAPTGTLIWDRSAHSWRVG